MCPQNRILLFNYVVHFNSSLVNVSIAEARKQRKTHVKTATKHAQNGYKQFGEFIFTPGRQFGVTIAFLPVAH